MKGKPKAKNYILENVKKLKLIQNSKPKSDDDDEDSKRKIEPPMSYAERLKTVTSPHIKLIEKLTCLRDVHVDSYNKGKKSNQLNTNFTDNKNKLCVESTHTLTKKRLNPKKMKKSKSEKLVKKYSKLTDDEKLMNDLQRCGTSYEPQSYCDSYKDHKESYGALSLIPEQKCGGDSKKNFEKNKVTISPFEAEPCKIEQNISVVCKPLSPKAYKNEGCQAKPYNSKESLDSNIVVRYPRRSDNTPSDQIKRVSLCEKSLQTEINSIESTPILKQPQKPAKKSPILNRKVIPSFEVKDMKKPNLSTSISSKNNQEHLSKNSSTQKLKLNPIEEKANMLLNEIITNSNVDIKKLHNEIGRVQKTSPFARHHTVFEQRSPAEIKKEHSNNMKNNPNRPPGTIVLPDHKRKEYLAQIKKRHGELLTQLNSLPVNTKSAEDRQQKIQLSQAIDYMDSAVKLFSKNNLLIDLNQLKCME